MKRPYDRAGLACVTLLYSNGEADDFIVTGFHARQVERFKNPDAVAEEYLMHFNQTGPVSKAPYGKIIFFMIRTTDAVWSLPERPPFP